MPLDWKTNYSRYRHYLPTGVGGLYKKKQVRVYTGFVLTLFTISFFLFFAVRPTITTITILIKTIEDQKKVSTTLQNKIISLGKAQEEYNAISSKLPLLDEAIPKEPQTDLLAQQLEVVAAQTGVKIESLKFESTPLWGNLAPDNLVSFSMLVSGDYPNLKEFLSQSLFLRRIVQIDSFGFQYILGKETVSEKTGSKNQEKILSLNLKAKAFSYVGITPTNTKINSGPPATSGGKTTN